MLSETLRSYWERRSEIRVWFLQSTYRLQSLESKSYYDMLSKREEQKSTRYKA